MFAKGTGVAAEKSRAKIEKLLRARKATQLGVSFDDENGEAIVIFTMPGKLITAAEPAKSWTNPPTPATAEVREPKQTVSFVVKMPKRSAFAKDHRGYIAPEWKVTQLHEQAIRERWRCLLMVLKGKFTAIDAEIEDFETAFLPHLLVPSGGTVRDHVMPAYRSSLSNPGAPLLGSGR